MLSVLMKDTHFFSAAIGSREQGRLDGKIEPMVKVSHRENSGVDFATIS